MLVFKKKKKKIKEKKQGFSKTQDYKNSKFPKIKSKL